MKSHAKLIRVIARVSLKLDMLLQGLAWHVMKPTGSCYPFVKVSG
jgi:hypothetical protein